mgnify:CR=1 FL=1
MKKIMLLWMSAFSLVCGEEAKPKSAAEPVAEPKTKVAKPEETVKPSTGSSPQQVEKPRGLSEAGREAFKAVLLENRKELVAMTPEARSTFMREAYRKIAKEEEAAKKAPSPEAK